MLTYLFDSINIALAVTFVLLNSFFVAAEFALVKVRSSRLEELKEQNRPFANTADWLFKRLNRTLSVCQIGITMASLALGWIGEPALAHLMQPAFIAVGITSQALLHAVAFGVAFSIITSLHIVIGEQVPKIYAIRRPGIVLLWCSAPLKMFYVFFYPFMLLLNNASLFFLRMLGIKELLDEHDIPLSEAEIRSSLSRSHRTGKLSGSEHRLLTAVFKFDDMVCRQIMVPRIEVEFLDVEKPFKENITFIKESHHTRLPLCQGSMDHVIGVIHVKNLIGISPDAPFELKNIAQEPLYIQETMPLSQLLTQFQTVHQHINFVVDEYGTILGIVTLEDVLEQIVGEVQDEFDEEPPDIITEGPGSYIILGGASIKDINDELNLELHTGEVDTISGLLFMQAGKMLSAGECVELNDGIKAEVLEVAGNRAIRVRLIISKPYGIETPDESDSN